MGETQLQNQEQPKTKKPRTAQNSLLRDLMALLLKIAVIVLAFILLFTFMYGIFRFESGSMSPALEDGDLVVFYRLDKDYVATDALVVEYQGERQVRRVVAVAGDTVDITQDGLVINGALQQEPNAETETLPYEEGVEFPLTVGAGQVFVLADQRENAADSRIYGCVNVDDTLGTVMAIVRRRGI